MARTKASDEKEVAKQKKKLEKPAAPPPTPTESEQPARHICSPLMSSSTHALLLQPHAHPCSSPPHNQFLPILPLATVFHRNLTLLDTYTEARDPIMLFRVFRYISHLRAHLPHSALKFAMDLYLSGESKARLHALLAALPVVVEEGKREGGMTDAPPATAAAAAAPLSTPSAATPAAAASGGVSSTTPAATGAATAAPTAPPKPRIPRPGGASAVELEVYLWIQVLSSLCAAHLWSSLQEGSQYLLDTILAPQNRRTLDSFQVSSYTRTAWGGAHPLCV